MPISIDLTQLAGLIAYILLFNIIYIMRILGNTVKRMGVDTCLQGDPV